jgi:predicted ABC-type exoprotein transport system permease subunit
MTVKTWARRSLLIFIYAPLFRAVTKILAQFWALLYGSLCRFVYMESLNYCLTMNRLLPLLIKSYIIRNDYHKGGLAVCKGFLATSITDCAGKG